MRWTGWKFWSPLNHPKNACTCSRDRRCGCKRMLIGFARSADQMSSPEVFLVAKLTAPVPDLVTFMMGSNLNWVVWSVRILVRMPEFSMMREIYFHPPVFSVVLYHCPLPSPEVRSINFILNRSIAFEYLGVDTSCTAETAVLTTVVMVPVREILQVLPWVLRETLCRLRRLCLWWCRPVHSYLCVRTFFSLCNELN